LEVDHEFVGVVGRCASAGNADGRQGFAPAAESLYDNVRAEGSILPGHEVLDAEGPDPVQGGVAAETGEDLLVGDVHHRRIDVEGELRPAQRRGPTRTLITCHDAPSDP